MWWKGTETLTDQEFGEALGLLETIFNDRERLQNIRSGIKALKWDVENNCLSCSSELVLCAMLETRGFISSYPITELKLKEEFWNRL